ncbi:APC family permease [Adlercreutzia sp. R25]|uniref:APC family permease n=1 Tax=Adlercreutzia shanghongiae TaxID=3111773 RepID=A0ABU6IVS3_9ACTN|nr:MULTISPECIES: APC family permease [unclassified Adlercreutzia]MEC4272209.1 APC family permease [Adlercreutzia sp. R25]MEC4293931.1 APC family permease [Adlercreutzia sp. R22]
MRGNATTAKTAPTASTVGSTPVPLATPKNAGATGTPAKAGAGTVAAAPSQAGGDTFKRTFTVKDMVVWGLICMVPISPMAIYGGVFADSNGMPTLAFLVGFVAVLFSVFSFAIMIRHFPSSGSIFTYVSHVMGKFMGFIAGWLMLLQYLVAPALVYLIAAIAIHSIVPELPVLALCFAFLIVVSVVSLIGMKTAVAVNRIALVAQLIILALFVGFGVAYVIGHPETSSFSATNFYNPKAFDVSSTMSSVSLAAMSFVGFGAIATLTQEAKDPTRGPGRAMMIMVFVLAALYALQCFVATCVDPTGAAFADNTDNAFYVIARLVAGPWLSILCAVGVALAQGLFTAIAQQASIAFVMFTMARGGTLPKFMGKMSKRTNSPINAILFISVLSAVLILVFHFAGINMNTIAKINTFGALATYVLLNVSVIVLCWFQLKQRKGVRAVVRHLIFPALGAVICFAIMLSVKDVALVVGCAWILVGVVYYCVLKYALRRDIQLG